MNPFLKAGMLTITVVVLAFVLMSQVDNARARELEKGVDNVLSEAQAEAVLREYTRVMARTPQEQCPYLLSLRQKQLDKTYALALRLQDYERSNVLNDEYEQLKVSYFLGLSSMYISGFELHNSCGISEVPLVLFYSEKNTCQECVAQDIVLSSVAKRCSGMRIYAFPYDSTLEPVQIISDRYEISSVPSIVIGDRTAQKGMQGEDELVSQLRLRGASCT